jgi:thiamine pyrophosphate-dependent acetolactate synthase large subunit-like protein
MAQAMGCVGIRIETVKDLLGELERIKGATEPVVLDVVTTEDAPFWQVQSPLAKEGPGGE